MEINSKSKIIFLFTVCVSVRLLIANYIRFISNNTYNKGKANYNKTIVYLSSLVLLFVSIGFLNRYLSYKKEDKGVFKTNVWWNDYRLFHSITYFLAALFLLSNKYYMFSFYILIIDVIAGILFFTYNKVNS
jgi:hypothetical protein